jgi:hypothetical protein
MSQLTAALTDTGSTNEPPARIAPEVTNRELIWDGGIVEIHIPTRNKTGTFKGSVEITYLQFPTNVSGGVINMHVHGERPSQWAGRKITARVELWEKQLNNETGYFYIDLHPQKSPATHQMRIESADADGKLPDWVNSEELVFEPSFPPLKVAVVFTPLPPAPQSTGDQQLDRYLADGWLEDRSRSDETTVYLFKMKGEIRRELKHHRPKKRQNR